MKKNIAMLLVLAIVVLSTMILTGNVLAVNSTTIGANTTPGTVQTLPVTKTITDVTNPVTATFTYHIAEATGNPATVTNLPADFTITFNDAIPSNTYEVVETTTLNMSTATFTTLGDYKFVVTETGTSDDTTYPIDTKEYYVYVQVRNELDSNNVPTGNLVATLVPTTKLDDQGGKVDMHYNTQANNTHIEISKSVTGNIADSDAYFKFALNIPGDTGDVYKIIGSHSTDGTTTVSHSDYTVGTTQYIYLKHGQTVTVGRTSNNISQIPIGTTYTIVEQDATDYETYIDESTTNSKTMNGKRTVDESDTDFNTYNSTSFVNHKETPVLTGLFINSAPFVLLIALAVIGIVILKKTSKKEN